ncbi:MAG: hypothetical protein RMM17_06500 [Acidobacteriota bacterium]|nr:hypothetical protein [Blastocatellia bacterium]MDW8412314.1 hypothetical protein [Acidobacteriota bacterium]
MGLFDRLNVGLTEESRLQGKVLKEVVATESQSTEAWERSADCCERLEEQCRVYIRSDLETHQILFVRLTEEIVAFYGIMQRTDGNFCSDIKFIDRHKILDSI